MKYFLLIIAAVGITGMVILLNNTTTGMQGYDWGRDSVLAYGGYPGAKITSGTICEKLIRQGKIPPEFLETMTYHDTEEASLNLQEDCVSASLYGWPGYCCKKK